MKRHDIIFVLILSVLIPAFILINAPKRSFGDVAEIQTQTMVSNNDLAVTHSIHVLLADGAVVQMELESYLTGVLLCEMPADFEIEALKSQAVVARTYALKRDLSRKKHVSAAVCTKANCCQGYISENDYLNNGGTKEDIERIMLAVTETSGQVLTFAGSLIDATYFSCSGGRTEDALAVWGTDIPYLRSVESPGEETATYYMDTITLSVDELQSKLDVTLSGSADQWFNETKHTSGGGVASIIIGGKKFSGTEVRHKLGLRSTSFVMTAIGNRVIVTTKGFGHRVGMSQYGAEAMAISGKKYTEILSHYYSNTELIMYLP